MKAQSHVKVSELADFDAAEFLETPEDIASYISAVLEDGDSSLVAAALGDIARARGMTEVARDAEISREVLYKALRPNSAPRLDTILKVLDAFGVELVARPISKHQPAKKPANTQAHAAKVEPTPRARKSTELRSRHAKTVATGTV